MNKKILLIGILVLAGLLALVIKIETSRKPSTQSSVRPADIPTQEEPPAEQKLEIASAAPVETVQSEVTQPVEVASQPIIVVGGNPAFNDEQVFEKPTTNSALERLEQLDAHAAQVARAMSEYNSRTR